MNNNNMNKPNIPGNQGPAQATPQKPPQGPQGGTGIIPPPTPGPALTMKGTMPQQEPQQLKVPVPPTPPATPAQIQQKMPAATPPKPNLASPPPQKPNPPPAALSSPPPTQANKNQNQPQKPPMGGNVNGQQQQQNKPQQQQNKQHGNQQHQGGPRSGGGQHNRQHNRPQHHHHNQQQQQRERPSNAANATNAAADSAPPSEFKATLSLLLKPGEKTYTQRCRLFIGNLPNDISEEEFKKLFAKYGEPSEVFINKGKGFGFIRLESRAIAEIAKAELDDIPMKGRPLRVRFATHSAALSVKNLSPFVSNELLEEAFSQFGMVERSIVIVDDRGRSTGKGIIEFASRPAARKALDRCNEGVFLLTTSPRPVVVEPLEQYDDEDGLPEKLAQKNPRYQKEREEPPRFARPGTFEYEYSKRWKSLDEMEKQQRQQVEKNMKEAREKLESEMEDAFHEHQANLLRQDLLRRQEELRRMEEMHSQEMQKRKEMQLRQEEERRRREEEMLRKREMEEQMRRQREENYRMGNFMDRDREMRMNAGGAMGMTDMAFGTPNQKFPMGGMGFEGQSSSGGMMPNEMRNERFQQGGPRGMGPGNAGFGRVREEFDGPAKKARF